MTNRKPKPEQPVSKQVAYGMELEQTVKRLKVSVEFWVTALGLDKWRRITMDYAAAINKDKPHSQACADASWEYREATITFYLPNLAECDDEELDYIVRHEFMHALVNEMRWQEKNTTDLTHEERVVTELAIAAGRIRSQAEAKQKKA